MSPSAVDSIPEESSLQLAAQVNQIERARHLIQSGTDISTRNVCRRTLLHFATTSFDIARILVVLVADVHARD
jgi:hypothetical protein